MVEHEKIGTEESKTIMSKCEEVTLQMVKYWDRKGKGMTSGKEDPHTTEITSVWDCYYP